MWKTGAMVSDRISLFLLRRNFTACRWMSWIQQIEWITCQLLSFVRANCFHDTWNFIRNTGLVLKITHTLVQFVKEWWVSWRFRRMVIPNCIGKKLCYHLWKKYRDIKGNYVQGFKKKFSGKLFYYSILFFCMWLNINLFCTYFSILRVGLLTNSELEQVELLGDKQCPDCFIIHCHNHHKLYRTK